MDNIIVNAPIQNRDFSPDQKLGKVVPLFASVWLTRHSAHDGDPKPVELWNNIIADQQTGHTQQSYDELTRSRLDKKYASQVLSILHSRTQAPVVLTDTDDTFKSWAAKKVEQSLERGDMRIVKLGIYACTQCNGSLAIRQGPKPRSCVACPVGTAEVVEDTRTVLVAELTDASSQAVDEATNTHVALRPHEGIFIVNKRRLDGVPLENIGFKGDVLDPRISLGLLALYVAEISLANKATVVTSRATVRQNLPQFYAAMLSQRSELPTLKTQGIAKAPVNYLQHLRDDGMINTENMVELLISRLMPHLFSMHNDMSPAHAEQLIFSRK